MPRAPSRANYDGERWTCVQPAYRDRDLKRATGVNINYIPYQGTTPAVNALMGEHLTSVMSSYPNVSELIRTGRLRALATTTAERIESMPDLPTVAELPGSRTSMWTYGSASTPRPRRRAK